jgi:hypothetical protein
MIDLIVPSGRIRPRRYGTMTCFAVETLRHFWWLPSGVAFRVHPTVTSTSFAIGASSISAGER